jgi:hypothetical protein
MDVSGLAHPSPPPAFDREPRLLQPLAKIASKAVELIATAELMNDLKLSQLVTPQRTACVTAAALLAATLVSCTPSNAGAENRTQA